MTFPINMKSCNKMKLCFSFKDGNQVYVGAVGSWYWQGKIALIHNITKSLNHNSIKLDLFTLYPFAIPYF